MATVAVYNMQGAEVGKMDLNDAIFGVEVNEHLVKMVVTAHLAAERQGTQKAKTRSEVSGGGRKPWKQKALIREIREELDADIVVGNLIDTIEFDYPDFHLSMDCFWCELQSEHVVLNEHEDAKWLSKAQLDSVDWLPADVTLVDKIAKGM